MEIRTDSKLDRAIWADKDHGVIKVIDQRLLPHQINIAELSTVDEIINAIKKMYVRGAPLIGITGAYGVYIATLNSIGSNNPDDQIISDCNRLKEARPTAVNLRWAIDRVLSKVISAKMDDKVKIAINEALKIDNEEENNCKKIGEHGVQLIENVYIKKNSGTVNILTHCNAGWLACNRYGTATAPIYAAFDKGIKIHVWVDETRPLNQGARLTAWEMYEYGIKHTVIPDNTAGHLMQKGLVDMVIVGSDRTTFTGDVANKIGTYLVALAASANSIPFFVALPSSTFDWEISDGINGIPIEIRDPDEFRYVQGLNGNKIERVLVPLTNSPAKNIAFDVTPSELVSGLITERGICGASEKEIKELFLDKK